MTPQELRQTIEKTEKLQFDHTFLQMPRTMPRGGYGRKVKTPFGLCDIVNADEKKVYFKVSLKQLKAFETAALAQVQKPVATYDPKQVTLTFQGKTITPPSECKCLYCDECLPSNKRN